MLKEFATEADIRSMIRRSHAFAFAALVSLLVILFGVISLPRVGLAEAQAATTPRVYVVRSGDSLSAIARRFDVTVAALRKANPRIGAAGVIRIGETIVVPKAQRATGLPATIRQDPQRLRLRPVIRHWAQKNGIPADLVEATLYLESGWNQAQISSTGAVGVGQIMPRTAAYIKSDLIGRRAGGFALNPAVPEHNIRMSARYLRHLLTVTDGNVESALHGYYQGFGSIRANGLYDDSKDYSAAIQALRKRFRSDLTGVDHR